MISYCRSLPVALAWLIGAIALGVIVFLALIRVIGPFRLLLIILACGWIPVLLRRWGTERPAMNIGKERLSGATPTMLVPGHGEP